MFAYISRRILTTIPLLAFATLIVYALVSAVGNPAAALAICGDRCDFSAFEQIARTNQLDKPVLPLNFPRITTNYQVDIDFDGIPDRIDRDRDGTKDTTKWYESRYGSWVGDALTGDLGQSTSANQPVGPLVRERAAFTARLAIPAFILIATLAIAVGVYSATNQYSFGDYAITGASFFGISMPTFVFALLLQVIFTIWWQDLFPNWRDIDPDGRNSFFYATQIHNDGFLDVIRSHTLPIVTLMLVITAAEARFERASMLEVVNSDYIRTARAKGLPQRTVIYKHALRNAMIPLVTIWALDFASLLGGSVVTESIFAWPGLGKLLLDGIFQSDLDLVMAIVMLVAVTVILFNLVADILYGVLDPRIRYE